MGSGYKQFTASVLTAADLNNYCQSQSVMYFTSTSNRDAAIASPVAGMVAYIDSGNSSEGLYVYAGATGGWLKGPGWNAPWGLVARDNGVGPGTSTVGATETVIFTGTSFTAIANRNYQVTFSTVVTATAGDPYTVRLRQDSLTGTLSWGGNVIFTTSQTKLLIPLMASTIALSAGTHNFVLTLQRSSGTGTAQITTSEYANMVVQDIGASGAPA